MAAVRYVSLEPNWKNMRTWAKHGLRFASTPREKASFEEIIASCESAKKAGRPDTDWED